MIAPSSGGTGSAVPRDDWLIGGDRRTASAERIYSAAMDLIARDGFEAFDIDALAEYVHCSRATVYRHAGGKAAIRDVVLARAAARIVERVLDSVAGLSGQARVVAAIVAALDLIRSDPLGKLLTSTIRDAEGMTWLAESPMLAGFAADLTGITSDDDVAAQWIVRVVLSLMYWPLDDARLEREMVQRFVAPAFAGPP